LRVERTIRTSLRVLSITPNGLPLRNIRHNSVSTIIQQRVKEPNRALPSLQPGRIQQSNNPSPHGTRRRRATIPLKLGVVEAIVEGRDTHSRNIRESTTGEVCELGEVDCSFGLDVLVDVGVDGGLLVRGTREVVAEAAGGADPGDFGNVLSAADGGNVRAGAGNWGVNWRCCQSIEVSREAGRGQCLLLAASYQCWHGRLHQHQYLRLTRGW